MFHHKAQHSLSIKVVLSWFLMSFNGGFINASVFLATGRFVSHVTGLVTMLGVALGKQNYLEFFSLFFIPLFFLAGAFIAGMFIDRPLYQKKQPHFDYVMAMSSFCLFTAAFTSSIHPPSQNGFSYFGLLVLTCFACGLQNGALTSSSGASVRTTHLSGITTDLGLGLARILTIEKNEAHYREELRSNYLRIGTIFSFLLGATAGAWLFLKFSYSVFALCGGIALYASVMGRRLKQEAHRPEIVTPGP